MPLAAGSSRAVISKNIKEMQNAGHPHNVSVAAALHNADKYQHRAGGGGISMSPPFWERNEARMLNDKPHFGGLFHSDVAGRTDRLPHSVPADSFVVPASEVSTLGQGNTAAGAKILDGIVGSMTGPYGSKIPHASALKVPPAPHMGAIPAAPHLSLHLRSPGGDTPEDAPGVSKVLVAGGEYLISRDKIEEIGRRRRNAGLSKARTNLAAGHEWARDFVLRIRKQELNRLKTAPKPKA